MEVWGINYACKWVQIYNEGRRYTCNMKEIDGELYFIFKKEWHSVKEYASDHLKADNYRGLGYDEYYRNR